jgi:D-glycero-alpha-D-manno-heptose-7-phosphate kinase
MRVCLGGGGTDLPSFYEKHGGFVFSMAIDKYVYITLKKNILNDELRLQYSKTEIVDEVSNLQHDRAREALIQHSIKNGYEITSIADLPSNTGLGSSSTFLVALLTALRTQKRLDTTPMIVAEEACRIEINLLNEPVGKQDQTISAWGGVKLMEIEKSGYVNVSSLKNSHGSINSFINNAHIYSLGIRRSASEVLKEQNQMSPQTEESLLKIKDMGYRFYEAFEKENFDDYGRLLDEYWIEKKKLSNKVSVSSVDKIYEEVKREYNVLGGKIIGAGGGGFLMLYCNKEHQKLENFMKSKGFPRLFYQTDYQGAKVVADL